MTTIVSCSRSLKIGGSFFCSKAIIVQILLIWTCDHFAIMNIKTNSVNSQIKVSTDYNLESVWTKKCLLFYSLDVNQWCYSWSGLNSHYLGFYFQFPIKICLIEVKIPAGQRQIANQSVFLCVELIFSSLILQEEEEVSDCSSVRLTDEVRPGSICSVICMILPNAVVGRLCVFSISQFGL